MGGGGGVVVVGCRGCRTLTLYQSPHVNIPRCEHASGKRFLIEDAKEELDEAGAPSASQLMTTSLSLKSG
jgi:hypothetical protein